MRIVIFSKPFYPSVGGVEVTSRCLARALVALDHQVTLLTATPLDGQAELVEGFCIRRSCTVSSCFRTLGRADLLIIKGGMAIRPALVARLLRKPVVCWHETAVALDQPSRFPAWHPGHWLRRSAANHCRFHVGVSGACLRSARIPPAAGSAVIYNPVDPVYWEAGKAFRAVLAPAPPPPRQPSRPQPSFTHHRRVFEMPGHCEGLQEGISRHGRPASDITFEKPITVLYVGRMIVAKGVFVLAEALARLDLCGHHGCACFVGAGPDQVLLERALSRLRHIRVFVPGALNPSQLALVYAQARLLVVPSSTHPEGMGLVVAEALAFGLPVIASDQPALMEVIGDAGLTFPNGDAQALSDQIRALLIDHFLYRDLAARASRRASLFGYDTYVDNVAHLLRHVAGARPVGDIRLMSETRSAPPP